MAEASGQGTYQFQIPDPRCFPFREVKRETTQPFAHLGQDVEICWAVASEQPFLEYMDKFTPFTGRGSQGW